MQVRMSSGYFCSDMVTIQTVTDESLINIYVYMQNLAAR